MAAQAEIQKKELESEEVAEGKRKFNIYVSKPEKKTRKEVRKVMRKVNEDDTQALDLLFSFIGVSTQEDPQATRSKQESVLNMFSDMSKAQTSRSSAGTIEKAPAPLTQEEQIEAQMRSSRLRHDSSRDSKEFLPELLPVSCGYFHSIVRQLLMKQRKVMIRYILHETQGRAFDRLVSYSHYHSLADLLVELMQINVVYEPKNEVGSSLDEADDKASNESSDQEPPANPNAKL